LLHIQDRAQARNRQTTDKPFDPRESHLDARGAEAGRIIMQGMVLCQQ
jgi:hypothetical protein